MTDGSQRYDNIVQVHYRDTGQKLTDDADSKVHGDQHYFNWQPPGLGTYKWRVAAGDGIDRTAQSDWGYFRVSAGAGVPSPLTPAPSSSVPPGDVHFTWSDPGDEFGPSRSFNVQVKKDGGDWQDLGWHTDRDWTANGLTAGQYQWRVRSSNGEWPSEFSATVSFTVGGPKRLVLTDAACGHVVVNGTTHELPWDGTFGHGSSVQIEAVGDSRWELDRWSGDVPSGSTRSNPLTVVMDQDRTINTHFRRARRTLTIGDAGAGTVMVDGEPQRLPYSGTYLEGESVEIKAVANPCWQFQVWSGDVPEGMKTSNPLRVVMDADRRIQPHFQRERQMLRIEWAGAGTVWVNDTWQRLPYTGNFALGERVKIGASARSGWSFDMWTGDVPVDRRMDKPIYLVMDRDRTIRPNFARLHTLTIGSAGAGTVLVNGTARKLPYRDSFSHGDVVSLKPVPKPGWQFQCWTGDVRRGQKTADPLELVITGDCVIEPHFATVRRTLSIDWAGAGSVYVNGTWHKLPYSERFPDGAEVKIRAMPKSGWAFDGWTGNVPTGDVMSNPLMLTMNRDRTIDPHFRSSSTPSQLMGVTALPTASGAEICFTLSAPASVSADVLNIAGRSVKHIVTDRVCDSGPQSLAWNGSSDFGTRVPHGSYLVRVSVFGDDGQRSERLTTLQVR